MIEKALTVRDVLNNINETLADMEQTGITSLDMRASYAQFSIYDWWKERLSRSDLRQMKSFLTLAIDLGLEGHCCFKVGILGCSNGMWAYEQESATEDSPHGGKIIYRTFLGARNPKRYAFDMDDGNGFCDDYESVKEFTTAFLAAK